MTNFKGYIYPPLLALLLRPLAGMPEVPAAFAWLAVLNATLLAAMVVAYRGLRSFVSADAWRWLLAATLLFPPLLENLGFMQVGTPIILLMVLAGVAFLQPRSTPWSGFWIAVGSALRVSPALAGFAFLRREGASWRAIGVGLLTGVVLLAFMALASPRLGEFLTQVLPGLGHGSAVFDNEAPAGVALRLDLFVLGGTGGVLRYAGAVIAAIVIVITLVMGARPALTPRSRGAVFAAWVAAIPLVSSITWTHHLATELVVFAFLAPSLVFATRTWWLAATAYPLLWSHRVIQVLLVLFGLHNARDLGGPALVLLSATGMFGMLLLWVACLDVLRRPDTAASATLNHA